MSLAGWQPRWAIAANLQDFIAKSLQTLVQMEDVGIVDVVELRLGLARCFIGSERTSAFFQRIVAELRLGFAAMEPEQHGPYVAWNRVLADLLLAGELDRCASEMRAYLADSEEMLQRALGNRT